MATFRILVIAFLFTMLYSCSGLIKNEEEKEGNRFYSKAYNFSIQVPEKWNIHEDFDNITPVVFYIKDSIDGQQLNVTIVVTTDYITKKITLEEYSSGCLNYMQPRMNKFQLINEQKAKTNKYSLEYIKATYTHELNDIKFHNVLYNYYYGNIGYTITCSCIPSLFEKYDTLFEKISTSFKKY